LGKEILVDFSDTPNLLIIPKLNLINEEARPSGMVLLQAYLEGTTILFGTTGIWPRRWV
jgi:hypothetical protein